MDRCAQCGFEYDVAEAEAAGPAIVVGVSEFAHLLGAPASDVRHRPQPDTWSPLEYGCHLRDVLLVQRERVLAARRTDTPSFEPMGRDERVDHDGYSGQDPDAVGRQMTDAAAMFANVLARLGGAEWERRVVYGFPSTFERSLRWVAVHTLHEVRHHLLDVRGHVPRAPTMIDAAARRGRIAVPGPSRPRPASWPSATGSWPDWSTPTGFPGCRSPTDTHFAALVQSIVFQQLAGAAASTIHRRLVAALGGEVTPEAMLAIAPEDLRAAGMSGNKAASVCDLAAKVTRRHGGPRPSGPGP